MQLILIIKVYKLKLEDNIDIIFPQSLTCQSKETEEKAYPTNGRLKTPAKQEAEGRLRGKACAKHNGAGTEEDKKRHQLKRTDA